MNQTQQVLKAFGQRIQKSSTRHPSVKRKVFEVLKSENVDLFSPKSEQKRRLWSQIIPKRNTAVFSHKHASLKLGIGTILRQAKMIPHELPNLLEAKRGYIRILEKADAAPVLEWSMLHDE